MPLSDRERRLLAEMEQALSADDPRLVSALSGGPKVSGGVLKGALLTVAGIAILFGGLIAKTTLIGVVGFLVALTGVLLAAKGAPKAGSSKVKKAKGSRGSLSSRLEDRWDQRNQG